MKKKILLVIAFLLLVAGISSTYSYLTRTLEDNNQFTVGSCDITVNETGSIPDEVSANEAFTITDTITVTNSGSYPCYVRAAIDFDSYLSEAASTINGMNSKWVYDDGYYYYTDALSKNASTEPLMTGISVDELEASVAKDYKIGIYFEAIDSVGESSYSSAWNTFLEGGTQ